MIRKIFALASVPVAVALVALGATGAANASVRPDNIGNGVNITTNNGVAGYYTDNFGGVDTNLQWDQAITQADENMTAGTDGIGAQLSNPQSGQTFGAGVERLGTTDSFGVFYAYGFLNGDPGAIFNHPGSPITTADSNKALGGILPSVSPLQLTIPAASVNDVLHFWLHQVHAKTGQHRWWLKITVNDNGSDSATASIRLPRGVAPHFTQAGVGVQRALTGLTAPALPNPAVLLDSVSGITLTSPLSVAFNTFGCNNNVNSTLEANSSATTNGNMAAEPNPSAQIDPGPIEGSFRGGCGTVAYGFGDTASVNVFEGNQVS